MAAPRLRLCFSLYDELYMVDLDQTLYFMADDHYTHVYYTSGAHFMLPFALARVEERLALLALRQPHPFQRLGRKYIVNLDAVVHLNTAKQSLLLLTATGKSVALPISKPVLRELIALMSQTHGHTSG